MCVWECTKHRNQNKQAWNSPSGAARPEGNRFKASDNNEGNMRKYAQETFRGNRGKGQFMVGHVCLFSNIDQQAGTYYFWAKFITYFATLPLPCCTHVKFIPLRKMHTC